MGVACGQGDWGVDGCMFLSDGLELVGCFVDGMDVKSPSVVGKISLLPLSGKGECVVLVLGDRQPSNTGESTQFMTTAGFGRTGSSAFRICWESLTTGSCTDEPLRIGDGERDHDHICVTGVLGTEAHKEIGDFKDRWLQEDCDSRRNWERGTGVGERECPLGERGEGGGCGVKCDGEQDSTVGSPQRANCGCTGEWDLGECVEGEQC